MSLTVAIQMDPIAPININHDSSFGLALKAQERGHKLWYYTPDQLSYRDGRPFATVRPLTVRHVAGDHFTLGAPERRWLDSFDVVLLRQDPPFDMAYVTTTHMLERIHPKTLVVNDPFWVRNCPEKLLVTEFPQLTPPTLMTRDLALLREFHAEHGEIIVKPLYGNGGAGVFKVGPDGLNIGALQEMFAQMWREPFIVQKFLPDVAEGDKRIILVDGVAVGGINRVPAKGETRSNLHAGGTAMPLVMTARDHEICAAIGPLLRERGLVFVGIDVIGGWLTEINVTSPTGMWQAQRFGGYDGFGLLWDAIERRRKES